MSVALWWGTYVTISKQDIPVTGGLESPQAVLYRPILQKLASQTSDAQVSLLTNHVGIYSHRETQ